MENWKNKPLSEQFDIPSSREGSVKNNESEIILLKKRIKELRTFIEGLEFVPSGTIAMFGGSTAPDGWLVCDGTIVSRATYAALFAAIGTNYGAGNGSTTFQLPDLRERFPRGPGSNVAVGSVANVNTHAHTISVNVASGSHAHTHSFSRNFSGNTGNVGAHRHSTNTNTTGGGASTSSNNFNRNGGFGNLSMAAGSHAHVTPNHNHTINEGNAGGHSHSFSGGVSGNTGNASSANHNHNSSASSDTISHVPAYVTVSYIIKA